MSDDAKRPEIPRLYRLSEAVRLFFPTGGITVKTLRTEARKGRLDLIKIGIKHFVTLEGLNEMLERCTRPASESRPAPAQAANHNGPSFAERGQRARAALEEIIRGAKKRK